MFLPTARREGLTVRELPDETVVYDNKTTKAHCLNAIAALVWKNCDGAATVAELARRVGQPAAAVQLALEQLSRRNLLVQPAPTESTPARLARRAILKKLAVAAALPLVLSVTANRAHASVNGGNTCGCNCSNGTPSINFNRCASGLYSCDHCANKFSTVTTCTCL